MKIGLIYPKGAFLGTDPKLLSFWESARKNARGHLWSNFAVWSGFSLGLLIIAALTPKNVELKLVDENYDGIDFDERYDFVAISAMTQQAVRAYEIADAFRSKGVKTILGGIHPTVLPEEAKKHADIVVVGEGEEIWPELLKDIEKGAPKPYYRSTKPVDLAKSPTPRYELLKPENYKVVWIQTTRGCPRDCEFCSASNIFGAKYRHKKITQIDNEIVAIKNIWKKNAIFGFADDNMFVNRKYSRELLGVIKKHNIRWFAQTDISVAEDDNLLAMLRDSGCMMLFIGFETVDKNGLRLLDKTHWKYKQYDSYKKNIERIQSYGIGVLGAFILGLDTDNALVFKRTADFIIDNHLYGAQITVLTPLPGTRLRERLSKENRIISNNWADYSLTTVTFNPKNMTPGELQKGLLDVYKEVYSDEVNIERLKHYKRIFTELKKQKARI